MHDPILPPDNDIEPIYNPATLDHESPADESIIEIEDSHTEIDPIYNPATMEFTEDTKEDT